MAFLIVDGHGDPDTAPEYTQAVEALYTVSYSLKFAIKRAGDGFDHGVMPLEGLWWVADMSKFTTTKNSDWDWTAMIMQPDEVTQDLLEHALANTTAKKSLSAAAKLRLERFHEGSAAQVMHVGPTLLRARRSSDCTSSSPRATGAPRQASRDLSERPEALRCREAEDRGPTAVTHAS